MKNHVSMVNIQKFTDELHTSGHSPNQKPCDEIVTQRFFVDLEKHVNKTAAAWGAVKHSMVSGWMAPQTAASTAVFCFENTRCG